MHKINSYKINQGHYAKALFFLQDYHKLFFIPFEFSKIHEDFFMYN